ncbi:M24 family metallopeptidase [Ancylobacter sp. VNQ12]|uniref:M24 family metallopeptidase n=1 Tax=Ancylobacter sp. VNQ12 TaxID=3400920 RepID=UPI003BFFB9B2
MTVHPALLSEIETRVTNTQRLMRERGLDLLIVYGNNKLIGSLRYLTDYFADRAGWISLGIDHVEIVDGAAAVLTPTSPPQLLVDPGLMPTREICVDTIIGGDGFAAKAGDGLSLRNLERAITEAGGVRTVGIETLDKFPAPLLLGLRASFPDIAFVRSTVVEELRLIKSRYDLDMMRRAAEIGDRAHAAVEEALRTRPGITELELIRIAEATMRLANPIYEDSCTNSPSLICSSSTIAGTLLHLASGDKRIGPGDVVHWDICMRYQGYTIDTSRTRAIGTAPDSVKRAYDAVKEVHAAIIAAARPGTPAVELVRVGEAVAQRRGHTLWNRFIGHGLGWDGHERPDMGIEEMPLAENMVLAIEPRLAVDGRHLVGNEDMVVVTPGGGCSLTHFPADPLELKV